VVKERNNMQLMSLSENVIKALEFFIANSPPKLDLSKYNLPFVVGSGNAYNTGTILFSGKAAVFADESNFERLLVSYKDVIKKGMIREAVVISASGEKDSVWEIEHARKAGLHTVLLTTKENSGAAKIADEKFIYQSIAEPYTYNVSTYLGMILSATHENPKDVLDFIKNIKLPENFDGYQAYAFVLPDKFLPICPMLDIKRHELFGPHLSLRAFSFGHARHAKFVNRTHDELVITIGGENEVFGYPENRWTFSVPENFSFGSIMALTYYLTGKIQEGKPKYYAENIGEYCKSYGPKAYNKTEPFEVLVQGSNS